VIIDNNTLVHNSNLKLNIGGHFAMLNITRNTIQNNICKGNFIKPFLIYIFHFHLFYLHSKLFRWFDNDNGYGKVYVNLEKYDYFKHWRIYD